MSLHALLHPWVSAFTPAALASIAAGSILLAASILLVQTMRRETARNRYALLYGALLFFALPAHLLFFGVLFVQDDLRALFSPSDEVQTVSTAGAAIPVELPSVVRSDVDWECPLALLIVAGATALLVRLTVRTRTSRSILQRASRAADAEVLETVDALRTSMGVRDPLPVVVIAGVAAPAAIAIRKPALVIPDSALRRLTPNELRGVLAHEVAHVARRDNLAALVESLVAAVFWFNPLVWMVVIRLSLERERACDDAAIGPHAEPETFLRALLTLCRETVHEHHRAVSCISNSKISERVDYLMNHERLASSPRVRALVYSAALLIALAASSALALAVDPPAVTSSSSYAMQVTAQPRPNDQIQVDIAVTDPDGDLIAAPRVVTIATEPARLHSEYGRRSIDILVTFPGNDRGEAHLVVKEEGRVVAEQRTSFTIATDAPKFSGQPIDVKLKDADLNDVLAMLAQLSGTKIVVDARVRGKVTVEFDDTPWDQVLDHVVRSKGLSLRLDAGVIYVEPNSTTPSGAFRGTPQYSGEPIDLKLKDADLRDVMKTLSRITATEIVVAPGIERKVTVEYDDVPWDQALEEIAAQQGLRLRVDGKTIRLEEAPAGDGRSQ